MFPEGLQAIDQSVTLWINGFHHWSTDAIWLLFSDKMAWAPMYLLLIGLIWLRLGWKKALFIYLAIILTIVSCDQFSEFLKHTVGRFRPCYIPEMIQGNLHILEGRGGLYGFYSSHAANAFGLATASYLGLSSNDKTHTYSTYRMCLYAWAFCVAVSRIFVGKHFAGDVLAGIFFGLFFGYAIATICNYGIRRSEKKI